MISCCAPGPRMSSRRKACARRWPASSRRWRLDPVYAPAMAAAAYVARSAISRAGSRRTIKASVRGQPRVARGRACAERCAGVCGWRRSRSGTWRRTGASGQGILFRRSLLINPNSAMALTLAGWIETMCGNQVAGRELVARAQRLNPRDPHGWISAGALAVAAIAEGDFSQAIGWAEKALAQNGRHAVALRALAVAEVNERRIERARLAIAALLRVEPRLTISGFFERIPFPSAVMARTYAEGLAAAGLPR